MRRTAFLALSTWFAITAASAEEPYASVQFREVVSAHWNDFLKRHPIEATMYVGDHRYDDRVNDVSLGAYDAWLASLRETRGKLAAIDANALSENERIDRDVLLGVIDDRLDLVPFGDHLIPLTQLVRPTVDVRTEDYHLVFAQLGEFQPAATAGDVENFVRRLRAFPGLVDQLIVVLRQGIREHRMPPKLVAERVASQLRTLSEPAVASHPLWVYTNRLPSDWPEGERRTAIDRVRQALATEVIPAYGRLLGVVESEYLPACRESVGLVATEQGTAHYARLVRHYTTTDLTPEQVHEIGLTQLAKTRSAMEAIRERVGFSGDLKAFFAHLRTDPKFKNRDEASILEGHRRIVATMQKHLHRLLGHLPTTPIEVRPFDPIRAKTSPTGEYLPVPSDGSRPGIFYVNTSDPTSRPYYTMQALAYHEALPGHHLMMSLSLESPGRPAFRRYFYMPAADEGWALYSESLPREIGLYTDPYSEFGQLDYDAHRCVRLVVDTGIHAQGWSRDRAIEFFEANTSLPRNEITNEVDRYIAWPGQALAYKLGELKIRELRDQAQQQAGARFDLRAFHDRLLSHGALPLRQLERVVSSAPQSRGD